MLLIHISAPPVIVILTNVNEADTWHICIFLLMIAAISHIFQCENFFELLLQNAYIILKFVRMTGIITKKLAINVRRYESKLHELNWEAKINKIWNKGNGNNISKYHPVWSESFEKKAGNGGNLTEMVCHEMTWS